jgi:transaldolase
MRTALTDLTSAGVSIWIDDLSREGLMSGALARRVAEFATTGVTTNPTIFARSITSGQAYEPAIRDLRRQGVHAGEAMRLLTAEDVRSAADLLLPTYMSTEARDGFVSIEVDPAFSYDVEGTIAAARLLHWLVDRPNVMVKIPATQAALPAITHCLAEGISVNVTLIFSPQRYRQVFEAALTGMELALRAGRDIRQLRSVASFFVSRIDTAVNAAVHDPRDLDAAATSTGVASALLSYEFYREEMNGDRAQAITARGGLVQRPLWASTGVKDPAYKNTMYVDQLVTPGAINTMPAATLDAFARDGSPGSPVGDADFDKARETLAAVSGLGVDMKGIVAALERAGVRSFQESWEALGSSLAQRLSSEVF